MANIRKGFALVEILIIIAFTGALTTALTMSNRNAASSVQASRIISKLRSARTAALLKKNEGIEAIRYLNGCVIVKTEEGVYAGYELSDDARIREKLTAKAEEAKLLGSDMKSPYNNGGQVWIRIITTES